MTEVLTYGCDPEFFLHDGREFISAYGLFPGTKTNPFKLDKGALQVDGMALEFNIDPATSEEEFCGNIATVLTQINEIIHGVSPDLRSVFTPIADFDQEYFSLQPLAAKILGCDPDYSPDGKQKSPDARLQNTPTRTAAGHAHIGWTKGKSKNDADHFEDCKVIAKQFLNVPFFYPETPEEKRRIEYYGSEGSFRPTSYGLEIRSPSNIWVSQPETRIKMFRNMRTTMDKILKGEIHAV